MASSAVNVREVVSFGPRRKSILVSDEPLLDPFVKVAVVTLVLSDCPKLVRVSSCTMIARCAHHWHMHNASEERGGKRGGGGRNHLLRGRSLVARSATGTSSTVDRALEK